MIAMAKSSEAGTNAGVMVRVLRELAGGSFLLVPREEPNQDNSRCAPMAETWKAHAGKPRADEWEAPLFWVLSALLAGAACLFLLLYSLCQPKTNLNPGLAAYTPPPGTRLLPLPRQSDAPELAELPADSPPPSLSSSSPLKALAQAQPGDPPVKREIRLAARKRPHADPREHADPHEYDQQGAGFVQQWNFGYRGWNNTNNNNHVSSGTPKSWF
jgi:hypothetical protein